MTNHGVQFPRFFVTAPSPCPYLEDREERKVFTELEGPDAGALNEALGKVGFRRSQTVAYRPACENCSSCISVRIRIGEFAHTRSMKRIVKKNRDIIATVVENRVTDEQFDLLSTYLTDRHSDGSMADMSIEEFREMAETSPVETILIEYRRALSNELIAVALTDQLSDGLSMVYSFFSGEVPELSLGTYVILDHIERAKNHVMPYVYLGYWVKGSRKMDYKIRFKPIERLGPDGWHVLEEQNETLS